MHVVIFQRTPNSTTFGWEQGLELLGHRVTVLTASPRRQFGGRPGAHIEVLENSSWSERITRSSAILKSRIEPFPRGRDIRDLLDRLRPDAAIVKVDKARNLVIGRALSRRRVPWIAWQEKLPPRSRRWALGRLLGARPGVTFTALDSRPGGVSFASAETTMPRISYVPFGWEASPARGHRSGAPLRVLVVASFKNYTAKQQWTVIEAAARAGLLDGSLRFTFSGQGRPSHIGYERVEAAARKHGVEALVDLRCNVPFEEMPDLYRSHDFLILPSVREQFGMAIVEGMSFGLPVIVSDAVGAIGCVVHRENGLVFPVGDVAALAQSLRLLVDDDNLRASLASGAQQFASEYLDAARAAQRIMGLLKEASP